jgi:two-component system sensor histidine kinase KdpD
MTKLESGAIAPNASPHDIGEIVGTALQRASKILARHRVEVEISSDLPMVMVDAVLFEQVLFNLLDNAAKYAPPDTTISILSWRDGRSVRLQKRDQVRAGTGLGLAISRGFVEALHGTISAANRSDRAGAVFTISLPIPQVAEKQDAAA